MLCVEYRLVSVEYFLDRMQFWELDVLLDAVEYAERGEWERTRLQMLVTAQANSRKKLNVTDIMKFPWEKDADDERRRPMTADEKKAMQKQAEEVAARIFKDDGK